MSPYLLVFEEVLGMVDKIGKIAGLGRGSGVASLVNYGMGIVNVDPIKWDLLFERFLLDERIAVINMNLEGIENNIDEFSQNIILSQIELLLNYSQRFYQRQFLTRKKNNHEVLGRLEDLLNEFTINRKHSISLLNSLTDEDLSFIGNANGASMSARAAAFTVIGHDIWHMEVIQNKYL